MKLENSEISDKKIWLGQYLYYYRINQKILALFARGLPFIMISVVVIGLLIAYILKRSDLAIRGMIWILPIIFSSYMLISDNKYNNQYNNQNGLKNYNNFKNLISFSFNQKTLILIFCLLYNLSILAIITNPYRPWYYFVIISILYILTFLQIYSKPIKSNIILFEIIFILLNLTYGLTLKYPYYFGWTDIIGHLFLSKVTYLSGHIVPVDLTVYYAYFPLYHILIAESSYLLGTDLKTSLFIILGFIFAIHIIFIYYLFNYITHDERLSLSTCLLYSASYIVVFYAAYNITRVMAYLGFVILLYLIYKSESLNRLDNNIYKILAILFVTFIILVHQVSTAQIVIIMFILLLCERFIGYKNYLSNNFFILINILFLAYWFFTADLFTNNIIYTYSRPEDFNQIIIKQTVVAGNEGSFLTTNIDTTIFIFFVLVGIGYIFWKRRQSYVHVFGLFVLATSVLYFPNPIQTLWQTMVLFRFDRFELLLSPFMAFIMAIGINDFYDYLLRHISIKKSNIIIITIFSIFIFASVISNATDSKELDFGVKLDNTNYFNNVELKGFNHIIAYIPFGSTIHSDFYTNRYFLGDEFNESKSKKFDILYNFPYYNTNDIKNTSDMFRYRGYTVIRDRAFNKYEKELYKNSSNINNKIYSDYSVDIYIS